MAPTATCWYPNFPLPGVASDLDIIREVSVGNLRWLRVRAATLACVRVVHGAQTRQRTRVGVEEKRKMPSSFLSGRIALATCRVLAQACAGDPGLEAADRGTTSTPEAVAPAPTSNGPNVEAPVVVQPGDVQEEDVLSLLRGDGSEFEPPASSYEEPAAEQSAEEPSVLAAELAADGSCCSDGDCVCRGPEPTGSTLDRNGPYRYDSYSRGFSTRGYGGATIYYPTNAEAPYSAVVMCPGYTAGKSSIAAWGPFFASHGIVLMVIDTVTPLDQVVQRDDQLLAALDALKREGSRAGSPLNGKLSDTRYGLAGWSMGGGGTWLASADHPELKTAVTLAGHNLTALGGAGSRNSRVPTLMMNGALDTTILGGLGQSESAYDNIPDSTPKLLYVMSNAGHFAWGTPTTNRNASGRYMMAWQKTFLEGDTRYRKFLLERGPNATTFKSNLN
jgi:dienelactone hydrolase